MCTRKEFRDSLLVANYLQQSEKRGSDERTRPREE
jgi:hypothetical protein